MNKILSISRAKRFSPNSVERDNAILSLIEKELTQAGVEFTSTDEDTMQDIPLGIYCIVSMARSTKAISMLSEAEKQGAKVINPTIGLSNAKRSHIARLFPASAIPYPESIIISPDFSVEKIKISFPLWVKRSDECAQSESDVKFIKSQEELNEALSDASKRGIKEIVISKHIEGDLIKFYGVSGTNFFSWDYANFSKFGLESINGETKHYSFSSESLKEKCMKASLLINLPIYGGDAIVRADGSFVIIDFNDFPSFSPCRAEAAKAIKELLLTSI